MKHPDNPPSGIHEITVDGNGYFIQCPSEFSGNGPITVADEVWATFTNTVFKDLNPSFIDLLGANPGNVAGSRVLFGADCFIELPSNVDMTQTWSFVGASTIRGKGAALDMANIPNAITVSAGIALTLEDVRITGLENGGTSGLEYGRINLHDDTASLNLKRSDLVLEGAYTFSRGVINVYEDCLVSGKDQVFTYSSGAQSTIQADATWRFDRNTTLSYEADMGVNPDSWTETTYNNSRNRIKLNTTTSRLFLDGCTLWSTHTGIYLDTGVLVVNDKVTLRSVAGVEEGITGIGNYATQASGEEAEFNANLRIEMLAGAVLDVNGHLKYE
jgi:hypothetical protein